ncbi:MAG TPA: amino acid adenylation domain-containing protein, partial [Longimicrobiaceae bacterium]
QLAGAPAVLELPADRPRPAAQSFRGAVLPVALGAELTQKLHGVARREGGTLFMSLLAGFAVLLARYAGAEDVVVGTPISGRTRRETEGLVGLFINTLPLRIDLSGDPTFPELVGRVRETLLRAHAHQELPFDKLVEELQVERSLSYTPVFQVMLSMQGLARPFEFGGVRAFPYPAESGTSKFDLSLVLQEEASTLHGYLEFSADLFEAATAERMRGHLRTLLERVAEDPDSRLSGVELLGDVERAQVVEEWSRSGDQPAPVDRCVHELFAEQAARTPDAVALVFGEERVTYSGLDRRSDALARVLSTRGVGPDVRVGICAERSPELVVGLLAILKAGGAYVPLDPAYPAERLAYMLSDAGVPVLLAQERMLERLPEFGGEVVVLEFAEVVPPARGGGESGVTPDHLAYVIYTSGSTGQPKGTEVPHRAIPGFFWDVEYARFDERTVLLQHSSTSWDALTLELWPALLKGGTCVLLPAQSSDPALLGEQVREHGVTATWISSAYFNSIVETTPEVLAGLELAMIGGEAVSIPHVRRAQELYPGLRIVNGYGPSECTVFTSCHVVPAVFDAPALPIGRPVGDRRVYLLDRDLGPVPVGVPGGLFVGGPAVARGYLGRPELTAERFVPDPFSGEPGARMYRSGDRVKWRADGLLEFVGREDFQVKVRGFRVEPGEVEAMLSAHPAVREAVVMVKEGAGGGGRLVGYVTAAEGESCDAAELRAWLGERLPGYMVPGSLVVLESLPLTPHGKVDRRALPEPEYGGAEAGYVAPRTVTEEVVAGIWAEVLGVERVGVGE